MVTLVQKAGIDLTEKDNHEWDGILSGPLPTGKTFMRQDEEAGRKTKVALFAGKVVALGNAYQVPYAGERNGAAYHHGYRIKAYTPTQNP